MRFPSIPLLATVICLSPFAHGAVNFFEGFENPAIPGPDPYLGVPNGAQDFDHPGWQVLSSSDYAVYLAEANFDFGGGALSGDSQALVFGGGNLPGGSVSILVSGFTGMELPTIKFDHWADYQENQTTTVTVTDPANSNNVLYSKEAVGDGSVNESFNSSPVGDTVVVTITQTGDTINSDASVDNLMITAIPEPTVALLGALGVLIGLTRRRR